MEPKVSLNASMMGRRTKLTAKELGYHTAWLPAYPHACLPASLSRLAETTSCLWSEHVDEYAPGRRMGTNANSCHLQSTSRVPGTLPISLLIFTAVL